MLFRLQTVNPLALASVLRQTTGSNLLKANRMPIDSRSMDIVEGVRQRFPFPEYMTGDLAAYHSVARVVSTYLKQGDRLLDFGSGPCDKTAVAAGLGVVCDAVDDLQDDWHLRGNNISKIQSFAKNNGITFSRTFKPPAPNTYDMVMMNDVLEHIADSPRDLLLDLVKGIKTEGYLFIYVPNLANIRKRLDLLRGRTNLPRFDLYYWYQGPWRGPRREYVRDDLLRLTKHLGLELTSLHTVHHMLHRVPRPLRGFYRFVTSIFPDWRDTWVLVAKKPSAWNAKHSLSDSEFGEIYGQVNKKSLYGGVPE
jgi:2-polyprenyl-3-methyl-5-hydroxy-6-metoxy-1,4-benzoquinol methylase